MDISAAVCFNHASSSSILHAPFFDQSHLQFYHRSSFFSPSKVCVTLPCRPAPSPMSKSAPFRAVADSVCDSVVEPTVEQALMKELANLKLQMKQKKKELKARMKDDKEKLKIEMKQGKKMKKENNVSEGKKKKNCSADSSSSSSSESSDGECRAVSMEMLRHGQIAIGDARANGEEGVCAPCKDGTIAVCGKTCSPASSLGHGVVESCAEGSSWLSGSGKSSAEVLFARASVGSLNGQFRGQVDAESHDRMVCGGLTISSIFHSVHSSNRIEVCAGGKCKKAGSEQLLSALQGGIPRALNVEAVPCKCMGKCSSTINVRVHKEDTNPQHHSHVGVGDAHLIINHHFGHQSVLPSELSKESMRSPSSLAIA